MEQRVSSEEGCLLRVNRSIQAEGSFAMTKEDMHFRRFLTRGKCNVSVAWLLCFALNVLKLHHKAKAGRLGNHLFIPKSKAAQISVIPKFHTQFFEQPTGRSPCYTLF